MIVTFSHDHIFYKDKNNQYFSTGKFPYYIWERYLRYFDKVNVLGRTNEFNPNLNLIISSRRFVEHFSVPNLSNVKSRFKNKKQAKKIIYTVLKDSDALITRLPSEIGLLSIKIAKEIGLTWAVELVGCPFNAYWFHGNPIGKIYAFIAYKRTKRVVRNSKFVLYVTDSYLQKKYPTSGIYTSASNVEIQSVKDDVLNKKLATIKESKNFIKIGLVGSISTKLKGIETAIKALKELKGAKKNYKLFVAGDGNPQKWINLVKKYNIQNNIEFLGTLKQGEEINSFIDNLNIYIQPSLTEGLPRALIEAMSRGCPAIGSNVGGIPELLDLEFVHKPKDYKQLTELIITLSENKELAKQQAVRNFNVAKKYYKEVLDEKRNKFWQTFYEYVKSNKS